MTTYLPIMAFVVQGFGHCVVNMFAIPCGMMPGANISISQCRVWNEILVIIGNMIITGLITATGLYFFFWGMAKADVLVAQSAE